MMVCYTPVLMYYNYLPCVSMLHAIRLKRGPFVAVDIFGTPPGPGGLWGIGSMGKYQIMSKNRNYAKKSLSNNVKYYNYAQKSAY